MSQRGPVRATVLHPPGADTGSSSISTLLGAQAALIGAGALCYFALRAKLRFDTWTAGRPTPPWLPEVTVPWATVGLVASALAVASIVALPGGPSPTIDGPRRAIARSWNDATTGYLTKSAPNS